MPTWHLAGQVCREMFHESTKYERNGTSLVGDNKFFQFLFGTDYSFGFSPEHLRSALMKLEWRLKQLLEQYNLYRYGIETQIAKDCGLHRHTVGKFLRNQIQSPKLEVMEKICVWLIERGVPAEILPGALLGVRPAGLWRAIGQSDRIHIYLGEYHLTASMITTPQVAPPVSISRHDAVVSSKIIHYLSSEADLRNAKPAVKMLYVPFTFTPGVVDTGDGGFDEDKERAGRIFKAMCNNRKNGWSIIMIGSQRVNYLVEYLVADLFDCEAFVSPVDETRVPFYLCYRKFDRPVPSCFGSPTNPPGKSGEIDHGTYYLDKNFEWQFLKWQRGKNDAGIVIIIREAENIVMALFGFSGRATNAIGNALLNNSEKFWPDSDSASGNTLSICDKEIGVYICHVKFCEVNRKESGMAYENLENDVVDVIPLHRKVLNKFLSKGQCRTT